MVYNMGWIRDGFIIIEIHRICNLLDFLIIELCEVCLKLFEGISTKMLILFHSEDIINLNFD